MTRPLIITVTVRVSLTLTDVVMSLMMSDSDELDLYEYMLALRTAKPPVGNQKFCAPGPLVKVSPCQ